MMNAAQVTESAKALALLEQSIRRLAVPAAQDPALKARLVAEILQLNGAEDRARLMQFVESGGVPEPTTVRPVDISIAVTGHTDNVGIAPQNRHEFADNQALSVARTEAVANYLSGALSLEPVQIRVVGRGSADPVRSNATAAGRAANRRVTVASSSTKPTEYER